MTIPNTFKLSTFLITLFLTTRSALVDAHPHHGEVPEEKLNAPIDTILWMHMALQAFVWGILFPVGMVFGLARSKWHTPTQVTGFVLTFGGYILAHNHTGRQFTHTFHGTFATFLYFPIVSQFILGVYLKLHIHEESIRPYAVKLHGVFGRLYPVLGWVQMLLGAMTVGGFCSDQAYDQCMGHYITGSLFVAAAIVASILIVAGHTWVERTGRNPEWFDSCVILGWGIFNIFTGRNGPIWAVDEMQHTLLCIVWLVSGALGLYFIRNGKRNILPGAVFVVSGLAMTQVHDSNESPFSTKLYGLFGSVIILAGIARLLEIFVFPETAPIALHTTPANKPTRKQIDIDDIDVHGDGTAESDHLLESGKTRQIKKPGNINLNKLKAEVKQRGFKPLAGRLVKHTTPFMLLTAGILYIGATDEEIDLARKKGFGAGDYIFLMLGLSTSLYAFVRLLIYLHDNTGRNALAKSNINASMLQHKARSPSATSSETLGDGDGEEYELNVKGKGKGKQGVVITHVIGDDDEDN